MLRLHYNYQSAQKKPDLFGLRLFSYCTSSVFLMDGPVLLYWFEIKQGRFAYHDWNDNFPLQALWLSTELKYSEPV